jgi:hypothetical protein
MAPEIPPRTLRGLKRTFLLLAVSIAFPSILLFALRKGANPLFVTWVALVGSALIASFGLWSAWRSWHDRTRSQQ